MTIHYKLLPGGYVDETGPHRGVPPGVTDLFFAHRRIFAPREVGMSQFRKASSDFHSLFCQEPFTNDAVHSREKVAGMFERGEISKEEADRMLHMRWEVNRKGEKIAKEYLDGEAEIKERSTRHERAQS